MFSSSASWRTRSLKSSHDSSRFAYSSVESSSTSVTSAKRVLLLSTQSNREILRLPRADEFRVEDVAPGPQIDDQRLEPSVEQAVGRVSGALGVEVLRLRAGSLAQGGGVLEPQPLDVALDARDHHVAVVYLAEQILELLRPLGRPGRLVAEHGRVQLEHVAQALGGDAHVVQGVDVRRVEHGGRERTQLVGAQRDDPSRVRAKVPLGVEPLYLARLHVA